MTLLFSATAIYFTLWLIITILANFKILKKRLLINLSRFFLIPNWAFFSPNPLIADYVLSYQFITNSNEETGFTCDNYLTKPMPFDILWNNRKRNNKFIVDAIQDLFEEIKSIKNKDYKTLPLSFSYLLILNYLTEKYKTAETTAIQFKIEEKLNYQTNKSNTLIFQSVFHNIVTTETNA